MTPTTKVLSAAAVLVVAACLVFSWDRNELPPEFTGRQAETPAAATAGVTVADNEGTDERTLVTEAITQTVSLAHPHRYRLLCRVIDRDGLPVRDAGVAFGPRDCALNQWSRLTGEDGTVELQWSGKVHAMTMSIGLRFRGHSQALREIEVRAGALSDIVLLAERGGGGGACQVAHNLTDNSDCRACHWGALLPHVFDVQLAYQEGLHPASHLADWLLAGKLRDLSEHHRELEESLDVEVNFEGEVAAVLEVPVMETTEVPVDTGTIKGVVHGVGGKPVAALTVIWSTTPDRPLGRTQTSPNGEFVLENVGAGSVEVRAGGGSPGIGRRTVQVFQEQTARCDIQLHRGDVLAGRVMLPDGVRIEGWRVEFVASDESWIDGTDVKADGTFALANLPRRPGMLLLWSRNSNRLPAAIDTSVVVGSTDMVFDLRSSGVPSGQLRLRPSQPQSTESQKIDVWVWQIESRRGAMAIRLRDGSFALTSLAPGFYRVTIGGVGVGWRDLGEHWVDGNGKVDLGTVSLAAPGRLRIEGLADGQLLQVFERRPNLDVRGEAEIGARRELLLPPGRWLALWGAPENLMSREFRVSSESETLLDVSPTQK